ncbi:hypothetical protein PFISCL1PPCAC_1905, partial [Pristionchus fissidentatus]
RSMTKFHQSKQTHSRGALTISTNVNSKEERVVSCGVDGIVVVWNKDSLVTDGSPEKREISDRTHSCVAMYNGHVYAGFTQTDLSTGVEKQVIGSFSMEEENDPPKNIMSFSLDVTAVSVSKDWIIAGSSDFSVKRAEREDPNSGYARYELNSQVLDIQINPIEKVFAVASCDGFVTFFAGEETEPVSAHKIFSPIRDLDDKFPRVLMTWSVDGRYLFVPCKGMVKALAKKGEKWTVEREFKHEDDKDDDFSVVTISPCGKYLAASTMSSLIHIWEIESGLLMSTADYGKERAGRITGLAYLGSKSLQLVLADSHGNVVSLGDSEKPKESKEPTRKSSAFIEDEAMQEDSFDADNGDEEKEEDDDDDEIVLNKDKKFIVDDDDMDEDTNMSSSIAAIKRKYGYDDNGERPDAVDENSMDGDPFDNIDARPSTSVRKEKTEKAAPVRVVEKYTPPLLPKYFSSASSPTNLNQRYLKWNGFGTIRVFESEDGDSSLEIRFHDSTIHAEILMSNSDIGYSMGDLNDKVVALATKMKGASKHLYVKLLNSWDSTDDHWEVEMAKGDLPEDVVVSSQFVALLCESRNIRIFTHAGTQRHVITHPSPLISMCAFSDRLAVVSVAGGPLFSNEIDYEFPMSVSEYRIGATQQWWSASPMAGSSSSLICEQSVALTKGAHLTWIAYTNRGRIVAQGSDSVIRLLVSNRDSSSSFWTPIFDGTESLTSPSDSVWPISVVEKPVMQLRYIYCRGVKYPMVTLKLTPIVANWTLPLCNKESAKSKEEESLFLNELALSAANDGVEIKDLSASHLKSVIKLFVLAMKADRDSRAVEMAGMTTSSKGVQLLVNYAAKSRKTALVEKVSEVGRRKAEEEEDAMNRENGVNGGWEERENGEGSSLGRVLPKKVALRRSIVAASASRYGVSEEREEESLSSLKEEPASEAGSVGVFETTQIAPRNPFKRSLDESIADTSSTSVFDDLDSPVPMRKKLKETQNTVQVSSSQKQAKLSFGSNKKVSGYDLWLVDNEERLKGEFVGGEEDFAKYCTQAYRILPAAERKEWRTKSEASS